MFGRNVKRQSLLHTRISTLNPLAPVSAMSSGGNNKLSFCAGNSMAGPKNNRTEQRRFWKGFGLLLSFESEHLWWTHAQTCDNVRVQSAGEWTASKHTLHMPKPAKMFFFEVLRNGLPRYILYTCRAQTCDNVRVQSAMEWTASTYSLHMIEYCRLSLEKRPCASLRKPARALLHFQKLYIYIYIIILKVAVC